MNFKAITDAIGTAEKYPYLLKVGIFGSYARGDVNSSSDVDIIFEYDNSNEEYLDNIDDFMEDLESKITTKIDYITLNSLMKGDSCDFREAVLNDVKWLYAK